jgi:hypothetical protein
MNRINKMNSEGYWLGFRRRNFFLNSNRSAPNSKANPHRWRLRQGNLRVELRALSRVPESISFDNKRIIDQQIGGKRSD